MSDRPGDAVYHVDDRIQSIVFVGVAGSTAMSVDRVLGIESILALTLVMLASWTMGLVGMGAMNRALEVLVRA
jgi:hypothetical protein